MLEWLKALRHLQERGSPSVLVTLAETRGSVPREAGTKMVVTDDAAFGTIGGGQLEHEGLKSARDMLAGGATSPQLRRFGLGPSLGQCCGGSACLLLDPLPTRPEPWQAALVERHIPAVLVSAIGAGGGKLVVSGEAVHGALSDPRRQAQALTKARAMLAAADAEVRLEAREDGAALLLEPMHSKALQVVVFGAGHVGRALVRILGELPCQVTWVDSRAEQFPADVPANIAIDCTDMSHYAVERAPPGSAFLVMTHSHALDLTLCEKILRRSDFAYFGLIGSAIKRAKFIRRFKARGIADDVIERMVCPIGIPDVPGKHPGEIAVAVAAQLLMLRPESARAEREVTVRVAS